MKPKETPRKNTNRNDSSGPVITLFVYGTLKSGFPNHDRFCRNAIDIQPATVWGRLYDLGSFPALEVPEETILAHGTDDPLADAATQARFEAEKAQHPDPPAKGPTRREWGLVHGELITFPDPVQNIPPLDYLEGFRPDKASLYHRVLVPAQANFRLTCAWVYVMRGPVRRQRIASGTWS
jgi:gamma-glutamylcyclotransferase (GGCT)/AIG2-like uncharacterized protein YtfP